MWTIRDIISRSFPWSKNDRKCPRQKASGGKTLENAEDGQSVLEENKNNAMIKSVIAQALRIQRERNFKFKGVTKMSGHSKFANIKHKKREKRCSKGVRFSLLSDVKLQSL